MESRHRAALALVALGPERAAMMLRRLPQEEALALSDEVSRIGGIDANTARDVLAELAGSMKKKPTSVATGGPDYAQEILKRAFGAELAAAQRDPSGPRGSTRRFDYIERASGAEVVRMLETEPRPVIALVLAHLDPAKAADILSRLDGDLRADIGLRLAQLRTVPRKVVEMVDDDLRARLAALLVQHVTNFDGVQILAQLLNNADQDTERQLLRDMAAKNPELTEQLRDALFVFDDIERLNDRAIQEILKAADTRVLATAMKGADATITERIYKNLSERARENLREEVEFLRGLKPAEIKEARKRIVGIVRQLEEAGSITIERAGGDGG
jgi:flagellar motor switch protein FliG